MIQDFKFKINNVTPNEKKFREESLNFFNKNGFPNKRLEEWKFTDFNQIVLDNFKELKSNYSVDTKKTIEPIIVIDKILDRNIRSNFKPLNSWNVISINTINR